jgi:hypothetical protein
MENEKKEEILKDLFENKLNIEKNMLGYIEMLMYPYKNMEDYIKYGDMFLKLELKSNKQKNLK